MKKLNKIILLLIVFVFSSTYSPNEFYNRSTEANSFFGIQNIEIKNNFLIQKNQIEKKLKNIYNKSIFLIKRKDIEEPLNEISFLEKVVVKKKYPNTIIITVFETHPVAILFIKEVKYLFDSSSNLISFDNNVKANQLPKVFGEGAKNNFMDFFNKLKNNSFPNNKIKNFYYFQIGRWDLELLSNKTIKFPENNIEEAIKKSIKLLNRKDFENYNIIDLRVDGKIIVE